MCARDARPIRCRFPDFSVSNAPSLRHEGQFPHLYSWVRSRGPHGGGRGPFETPVSCVAYRKDARPREVVTKSCTFVS